jgi:hypothetical protein
VSEGFSQLKIDVSRITPGMYMVSLNNSTDVSNKKVMIY